MTTLVTLGFALIIFLLCIAGLGISYFFIGKTKIQTRGCGWNPKDKSCKICGNKTKDC